VYIDRYVIMPNHIHAIVVIMKKNNYNSPQYCYADYPLKEKRSVSLIWMVNVFKGSVSKRIGRSIWQKGYHDHIIRNYDEYSLISKYICNNPCVWNIDCHNDSVR